MLHQFKEVIVNSKYVPGFNFVESVGLNVFPKIGIPSVFAKNSV